MITLCIIADTHRRHREIVVPPCDILIHCGDMCSFREDDLETLEDIDDWFATLPAKRVICVAGNHDYLLETEDYSFRHATLLRDQGVEIQGLKFYGSPWCPFLSGFAHYLDDTGLQECWRAIPAGIDVLVTHTPPYGVLDLPSSGDRHLGCEYLRDELSRIRPRLHVFGHIHASHGDHEGPITHSINAAVVGGRDMMVRHQPTLHRM